MAKKFWGGRFTKKTNPLVEEFTKSIRYDYKLADYDISGSIIHVEILKKAGYLTTLEAARLKNGLIAIHKNVKDGTFRPDKNSEDIHTDIQNKLADKVGDAALKLHTARSRNEQVAFSTKLYCIDMIGKIRDEIEVMDASFEKLAGKNKTMMIPGFTHLRHAQPVYLKDYLSAYGRMLGRDSGRLENIAKSIELTMGAGALAGTPIASKFYSKYIRPTANSLDSVSDRDFVIEILNALAITGMHLSRLAEDLIIWSTKEFDFIEIDEAFCTGSSLMPQKKNPDVLELVRGYAGRLYGNLMSVLTIMKGLPLTYNRDMQLDKEPLFSSVEIVTEELKLMAGIIKTLRFNKAKIEEHLEDEALYATDLVYYLVDKGVPFKEAHAVIGRLVKHTIDNSIEIKSMSDAELKKFSEKFVHKEIIKLFDPKISVESKKSIKR
ncbi:MAG: argininosuccinate lyase [Candidatus Omnitrophica bacterium]|nr:argininosuccinate lyase [Candidatus Omnitrophota bacterium]